MSKGGVSGVIGYFDGPNEILKGMEKVRASNFEKFDAFTPFPIHGMDDAQGLPRSHLPWITFVFGITGTCAAFTLQYWTSAIDWPIIVGGKPFNSWPAFVPVMFELTILFAGLATVFGMFALNKLPQLFHKTPDPGITCDKFAIMIEMPGVAGKRFTPFSVDAAENALRQAGAKDIRKVTAEGWF
jgi:hypothetical protein